MNCLHLIFCLVITTTTLISDSECRPTFWDAIPAVSQVKYLFLYTIGEDEEAQQTWDNFTNTTHLWENVRHLDDNIPGYGHVKSAIVGMNGDPVRSKEIFRAAQKSTFVIGGFLLGGPTGAVGGYIVADAVNSMADQKPVGIIDHAINFPNKTMGEHFDVLLDLTLVTGVSKGRSSPSKSVAKTISRSAEKTVQTRVTLKMEKVKTPTDKKTVRFNEELNKEYSVAGSKSEMPQKSLKKEKTA